MIANSKLIKSVERFDADVKAFAAMTGDAAAVLYEDAFTTRTVSDFKLYKNGVLTWKEDGRTERYEHFDEDDVRDTLRFWRANLRRARRYFSMDTDTLDAIQDGAIEDVNDGCDE